MINVVSLLGLFLLFPTIARAVSPCDPMVVVSVTDNLQTLIDANPEGTNFLIQTGVHRMDTFVIPKTGQVFIGEPGAILNGSKDITAEFDACEDGKWAAANQTMENPTLTASKCEDGTSRCLYPNDVYYDNLPLQRVMSRADVVPGTFYFDLTQDWIYIGNDPVGHTVEVGVATRAFKGWQTGVSGIMIRGLIVEKFANEATIGAINGRTGWIIESCEVRLNHGVGIQGQFIRNSHMHHNGQYGISDVPVNGIVEGNEIAFNHYAGYHPGYGGGSKFVNTSDILVKDNHVHDNNGPGLWTDGNNINIVYENNLVENNTGPGIFHEIGYAAIIRNNTVRNNNTAHLGESLWHGANILLNASQNVEIYGNTVEGGHGIGIVDTGTRGMGGYGPRLAQNNSVHDNTVTLRAGSLSGAVGVATAGGKSNQFANNTYRVEDLMGAYFQWTSVTNKDGWIALGQDVTGTFSLLP